MKTVMQELIEKLVTMSNNTYFKGNKSECDVIDKIKDIIRIDYLPKEKQQIVDAYVSGCVNHYENYENLANKYYNETFKD